MAKRIVPIILFTVLVVVAIAGVWVYHQEYFGKSSNPQTTLDRSDNQVDDLRCLETLLADLRKKAKFETDGTGEYRRVRGHHPLSKAAFQNNPKYDQDLVFTVSQSALEIYGDSETHRIISGHQNRLYNLYANRNPGKRLTINKLAEIEIRSMYYAGINDSIATGWVVLALEDLKEKGIKEITNIPWNGENFKRDNITGFDPICWGQPPEKNKASSRSLNY